ncbi:hypothetical protein QL285_009434 [Trifolium repens]|nr:hypothetical protein QL285_009434 [Trifolium repens]
MLLSCNSWLSTAAFYRCHLLLPCTAACYTFSLLFVNFTFNKLLPTYCCLLYTLIAIWKLSTCYILIVYCCNSANTAVLITMPQIMTKKVARKEAAIVADYIEGGIVGEFDEANQGLFMPLWIALSKHDDLLDVSAPHPLPVKDFY